MQIVKAKHETQRGKKNVTCSLFKQNPYNSHFLCTWEEPKNDLPETSLALSIDAFFVKEHVPDEEE